MSVEGLDFVCTGLPKAATGWLYDQLAFHPDSWMPPLKESGYLNHEISRVHGSEQRLSRLKNGAVRHDQDRERLRRKDLEPKRRSTERNMAFLRAVGELRGKPRDWTRYKQLSSVKRDLLSGDLTPGYCPLEDDMTAQTASELPSTKLLLLVRDLVNRTWSDRSMANRKENFNKSVLEDADAFRALQDKTQIANPVSPNGSG